MNGIMIVYFSVENKTTISSRETAAIDISSLNGSCYVRGARARYRVAANRLSMRSDHARTLIACIWHRVNKVPMYFPSTTSKMVTQRL